MLSPDNHLGIFAALMGLAALAFWLQTTRLGALLTGTVLVILMAIVAANVGLIPHQAPTYGFVFTYLVPVLIPLLLLQGDVRRLLREASRTALAFIVASAGTVAGVLLAISLLDLSTLAGSANINAEDKESAIAGLFAATYIGGSVNYAALGEMTGLSGDASFFSAATAADNLFSAIFLSVLGLLPGVQWLARRFHDHPQTKTHSSNSTISESNTVSMTPTSLCTALAVATLLVTISDALSAWLDFSGGRYIILTILTLALATLVPKLRDWCTGGFNKHRTFQAARIKTEAENHNPYNAMRVGEASKPGPGLVFETTNRSGARPFVERVQQSDADVIFGQETMARGEDWKSLNRKLKRVNEGKKAVTTQGIPGPKGGDSCGGNVG